MALVTDTQVQTVVRHFQAVLREKQWRLGEVGVACRKKNGYEPGFCTFFNLILVREGRKESRYSDARLVAKTFEVIIELKKTTSSMYWLDLIRYIEILLSKAGKLDNLRRAREAKKDSITVFIQSTKGVVKKIYFLDTAELVRFLDITEDEQRSQYAFYVRHGLANNNQLQISLKNLINGTRGMLLMVDKGEVTVTITNECKRHMDFPRKHRKEEFDEDCSEEEMLLRLIHACRKNEFSSADLYAARDGICGYGQPRIKKLLDAAVEKGVLEKGSRKGRYSLAETEDD